MKKNKNEAEKISNAKVTESPCDKLRKNDTEEKVLGFKKVLYGYNPDEVSALIKEINDSCEASLRLQDSKLSSMKEELALAIRERDYYIRKCKEMQTDAPPQSENNTSEHNAEISNLENIIEGLKKENEALSNENKASADKSSDSDLRRIEDLENEIKKSKEENLALSQRAETLEADSLRLRSALAELDEAKTLLEKKEKELKAKIGESDKKDEKISSLAKEKEASEKKSSELELENGILNRRIDECQDEINALNETNKSIIFENTEKLNSLENEYIRSKQELQKEIKLYGYYVDRAEITLAELGRQLGQIRQSIEKTDI